MMFSRNCNLLRGLRKVVNYTNSAPKEFTYCRFFAAKSQLQDVTEEHIKQNENPISKRPKVLKLPFNDTNLSKIMLQMKSKKLRNRSNLIYFEGKRLLCDALKCGIIPLQVYFTRTKDISDIEFPQDTKLIKIPYNDLKIWSDLTTCPGILTICRRPVIENTEGTIPVSIVCDNIREPGNLGAIIRNSSGAGAQDVFLTEGCVDLWDSKVIRGGMGSHFRIPVHEDITWENICGSLNQNTLFVIALNENNSNKDEIAPYYKIKYSDYEHITLVIGGETEGISDKAFSLSKQFNHSNVTIPLSQNVESLNSVSALSVILFEIKRQFEASNVENAA